MAFHGSFALASGTSALSSQFVHLSCIGRRLGATFVQTYVISMRLLLKHLLKSWSRRRARRRRIGDQWG